MKKKINVSFIMPERFRKNCFSEKEISRLKELANILHEADDDLSETRIKQKLENADVVISSWGTPMITEELFNHAENLKMLCHCAGSVKHTLPGPVLKKLKEKNIPVMTTSYALGIGVAEFTLGIIIAGLKKTFFMKENIRNGLWQEMQGRWFDQQPDALMPVEPYDIKVGVVGAGCCGSHLIKLLNNFEVEILIYDPWKSAEQCAAMGAVKAELSELMSTADVITLHAPGIPETDGMINAELIKSIKDGALFVNTAKGSEVDETALIKELQTGRFFACIDQTLIQPAPTNHPFRNMRNVMLTPHIAGHVNNGFKRQGRHVVDELERFNHGEKLNYQLNLDKLDIIE